MMRKILLILVSFLFINSCKQDFAVPTPSRYLVFGRIGGAIVYTGLPSIQIFEIDSTQLLVDNRNECYGDEFYQGIYSSLPESKFKFAKNLLNEFPLELLKEQPVIGEEDYDNAGMLYIAYVDHGIKNYWLINRDKKYVNPIYIKFVDRVIEVIEKIQ